jgi:hypothetical protein
MPELYLSRDLDGEGISIHDSMPKRVDGFDGGWGIIHRDDGTNSLAGVMFTKGTECLRKMLPPEGILRIRFELVPVGVETSPAVESASTGSG